jgi:hypothetical protein
MAASGVYLYRIEAKYGPEKKSAFTQVRKMIIIR